MKQWYALYVFLYSYAVCHSLHDRTILILLQVELQMHISYQLCVTLSDIHISFQHVKD